MAADRISRTNGAGDQRRDYVYVEGVVRANVLTLEDDPPSGACNIGTGVNELYVMLAEISAKNLLAEHGPAKPGEQLRCSVDPALAGRAMGWRPEVGLREGLKETLRFVGAL